MKAVLLPHQKHICVAEHPLEKSSLCKCTTIVCTKSEPAYLKFIFYIASIHCKLKLKVISQYTSYTTCIRSIVHFLHFYSSLLDKINFKCDTFCKGMLYNLKET